MKHKIIVGQVNDGIYVVSDDGAISHALGLNPLIPWHLVADTQESIGIRVEQMEQLLDAVLPQKGRVAASMRSIVETPVPLGRRAVGDPNGSAGETASTVVKPVTVSPSRGRAKKQNGKVTLEDLGLRAQQLWRLKAAGIKSVATLGRCTEELLIAKDGIGPAIVKSVKKGLKKHGLRLTAAV